MRKIVYLIAFIFNVISIQAQTALPVAATGNVLVNGTGASNASIASTATNGFKLAVNGAAILWGTNTNTVTSPTLYLRNTTATTGKIWAFNSDNLGVFSIADASGTTSPLTHVNRFVINATGNVGIGTAAPGNKLEIDNTIAGTSGLRFTRLTSASTAAASNGKVLTVDATGNVILATAGNGWNQNGNTVGAIKTFGTVDNFDLPFITNNTEKFRVTTGGNLLLGTATDAGFKLDINGTTRFRNALTVTNPAGDGILQTWKKTDPGTEVGKMEMVGDAGVFTVGYNWLSANRIVMDGGSFGGASSIKLFQGASTQNVFLTASGNSYLNGGNVGIGTVTPSAKLHTSGSVRMEGITGNNALTSLLVSDASGNLFYRDAATLAGGGASGWSLNGNTVGTIKTFGTVDNFDLPIITANTEKMRIFSNGNIGIGTNTNAGFKLDVAGVVHSNTGFMIDNNFTEAFYHSGPNTTKLTGGYAESIELGGPSGNRITINSHENFLNGVTYITGGLKTNTISPVGFVATYGSSANLPDIGVDISSNYINNGAGGPNFGATLAVGDANINTAGGVTNDLTTVLLRPVVNTSGGTTKLRGLYYKPTLTSTIGVTNIAIETVTGNTLLGTTSGNTLIGPVTDDGVNKLQVAGIIKSTGFILPCTGCAGKVLTSDANGVASWQPSSGGTGGSSVWTPVGVADITNGNTGNVGIGTSSPSAKLEVNGSARVKILNDADYFHIKSSGLQNWRKFADFNVTDPDGTTNSYGLNFNAYNNDGVNRILRINQYNSTGVVFGGGNFNFENTANFIGGIANTYHTDFNITLRANSMNPSPTGIRFSAENFAGPIMSIMQTGNVGIGANSPTAKLHTVGTLRFEGLANNSALTNILVADASGNIAYRDAATLGGSGSGSSNWSVSGNNIFNANAGLVVIGTVPAVLPTDANLKLAVNGNIYAQKLKITAAGWADYVFDPSYKLHPLTEVAQFIQQNQHLPEVPSAKEVEKNGIDVGENQVVLLKKIEELTLYMIEVNKKVEKLIQENAEMKKKLVRKTN